MLGEGEITGERAFSNRADRGGFALVEALVASALIGWILLAGLDFLVLEKRAEQRLAAQREAIRVLETVVESIRVDAIPLQVGKTELGAQEATQGMRVSLVVENEAGMSDLFRVRVEALFSVHGTLLSRDLETLVWRRL